MVRVVLVVLCLVVANLSYAECYFSMTNQSIYADRILRAELIEKISQHLEPVQPISVFGVKEGSCLYEAHIYAKDSFVYVSIQGPKINFTGMDNQNSLEGYKVAIDRAIRKQKVYTIVTNK